MGFAKRYWKQILCCIGGAWLFLSSLYLAIIGLATNHMFLQTPLSSVERVAVVLVVIQVFPIVIEPTSNEGGLLALLVLLSKGWAIGFGACHLYRRSLRFERKWVAIGWCFCAFSLVISAVLMLICITQMLDLTLSSRRSDVVSVGVQSFFLSASLLLPIGLILCFVSCFRLFTSKGNLNSESSGGFDRGST